MQNFSGLSGLGYWNDENKNGRNWSGYQLKDIGYICEWETVYDYPEEQDFSDLELKQYIQNMPKLSEEDARMFLAFVYNDSDYEDVDFMGDETYCMLTGNLNAVDYSVEELQAYIWDFSTFVRAAMNQYVKESDAAVKYLSDELIEYLSKELDGMNNLDEEIINETAETILGYLKDGIKVLCANVSAKRLGIELKEETFQDAQLILDIGEDVKSFKGSVDIYVARLTAGVQAFFLPIKSEAVGRYSYFLAYLNNRESVDSPDDYIFQTLIDYSLLAAKENSYWSGLLDMTTWINGKDAWYNHTDMINRWAEYFYCLEQYINEDYHVYQIEKVISPTCTKTGYTQYKCAYCGDFYYADPVEKLGHNMRFESYKDPTCTEKGNIAYYQCERCMGCFLDAQGERSVALESTELAPQGHSGGAADCVKKAVCQICGAEYGDLDGTKHVETELKGQKEATCTEEGYTGDVFCKACGVKIASGKNIEKLEHNYVVTTVQDATKEMEGMREYVCSNCGDRYTEIIPEIEDDISVSPAELVFNERGQSRIVTATVAPEQAVTWESDNEAVATVKDGIVKAVSSGTANITARAGNKTATVKVTVDIKENPTQQPSGSTGGNTGSAGSTGSNTAGTGSAGSTGSTGGNTGSAGGNTAGAGSVDNAGSTGSAGGNAGGTGSAGDTGNTGSDSNVDKDNDTGRDGTDKSDSADTLQDVSDKNDQTQTPDTDAAYEKGDQIRDKATKAVYEVTKEASESGKGGAIAYKAPSDKKASSVQIPKTVTLDGVTYKVTSVAANAFKNNKSLKKVTIGANITTIGKNAFYGCTKLKTVAMSNARTIGAKAFSGCTSLTKVALPAKTTSIGKQAFYKCAKLKTITIGTTKLTAKTVGADAFKGVYAKVTVKVPAKAYSRYKKLLPSCGLSKKAKIVKQ